MTGVGKRMWAGKRTGWDGWPCLIILVICFSIGALGGFLLAILGTPSAELRDYLLEYFTLAAQSRMEVSFLSVLWDLVRWPLCAFIFGNTTLGVAVIPGLLLIRGFLFSYATASFGVLLGTQGVAAAAALFGVTVLLAIPVLFLIGCEGLRAALRRLSRSAPGEGRCRLTVILPGTGLLALALALQWTVTPVLLAAACKRLFGS